MKKSFVVIGDLHFETNTDSRPGPIYMDTLEKLTYISDYCVRQNNTSLLVLTGDVFNNLNRYLYASAENRFKDFLSLFDAVIYIEGNHDRHKAVSYPDKSDTPLSKLFYGMSNVIDLGSIPYYDYGGWRFVGRSYLKEYDRGVSDGLNCPLEYDWTKTIVVAHAYLLPKELNVLNQYISYEALTNPARLYVVGHWHGCLGLRDHFYAAEAAPLKRVSFLTPGSLTRIKVSEKHNPSFFTVELDENSFTCVQHAVPCRDASEVFIDKTDSKVIEKIKSNISGFVDAISLNRKVMTSSDFYGAFCRVSDMQVPEEKQESVKSYMRGITAANI